MYYVSFPSTIVLRLKLYKNNLYLFHIKILNIYQSYIKGTN